MLDIPIPSLPITPNNLAWFDAALHVLASTGLTTEESTAVVLAVGAQARWEGTVRRGHADAEGENREAREAELLDHLWSPPRQFPEVAAALRNGAFAAGTGGSTFAFGLERLLDGVESYLAGRSPATMPAADPLDTEAARDARYKEAVKARREVEKKLREARKKERELLKAARERLAK